MHGACGRNNKDGIIIVFSGKRGLSHQCSEFYIITLSHSPGDEHRGCFLLTLPGALYDCRYLNRALTCDVKPGQTEWRCEQEFPRWWGINNARVRPGSASDLCAGSFHVFTLSFRTTNKLSYTRIKGAEERKRKNVRKKIQVLTEEKLYWDG